MNEFLGELLYHAAISSDEEIKELIKYLKQILKDRKR